MKHQVTVFGEARIDIVDTSLTLGDGGARWQIHLFFICLHNNASGRGIVHRDKIRSICFLYSTLIVFNKSGTSLIVPLLYMLELTTLACELVDYSCTSHGMITKDYSIFSVALELMRREAKQREMQELESHVASFHFNKNKLDSI